MASDRFLAALRAAPRLASDLEANSRYAYTERACLIQISTADADFILDPLAALDLSGLGEIVANPAVEKVAARTVSVGGTVLEVSEKVLSAITRRDNPQMVVGVFTQRYANLKDLRPADGEVA